MSQQGCGFQYTAIVFQSGLDSFEFAAYSSTRQPIFDRHLPDRSVDFE